MVSVKEKRKAAARKLLTKDEPTFTMLNSDVADLVKALNYYAIQNTFEDSKRFAVEWATANRPDLVSELVKSQELSFRNTGFLCRILENGYCDDDLEVRINVELEAICSLYREKKSSTHDEEKPKPKPFKRQDPNQILEQFDYAIDAISLGHQPDKISFSDNRKHLTEVSDAAKRLQIEVLEYPDQFFHVRELKKFLRDTIDKVDNVTKSVKANATRKVKPRKVDPIKMVSNLVLAPSDDELNVKTLKATSIVGATKLIVWHPERRTLSAYISVNDSGFLVSGRSLKNYDLEKSITKKIRKPAEMWKEIKDMTATRMHYWIRDTCKTTATPAKALIPDGSIIFKV